MKKSLFITLIGILVLLSMFSISATSTKGISIQGLDRTVANFSVLMYIPHQTNMNNDFSDVRFKEGSTNLSFYIENYSSGSYANVWVKIPSMTTTQKNITMEYNNGLSSASSFNDAFMYGDDFNSDTSANYQNNTHSKFVISNGVMNLTNLDGDSGYVYPKMAFQRKSLNYTVEARTKLDSALNNDMGYGVCGYSADLTSNNVGECFLLINSATKYRSITRIGVAHADIQAIGDFDFTRSEFHYQFFTLINANTNNKLTTYINDSFISKRDINDGTYTSGYYGMIGVLASGSVLYDWYRVRPYSNYMPNITIYSTSLGIPDVQFVNPTYENNDQFNRDYILINVTSNLAGLDNITVNIYNSSMDLLTILISNFTPLYYNYSVANNGYFYFNSTACNIDNCNHTETRQVLIDTFNPVVDIIYPEDNFYYSAMINELNISILNTGLIETCWFSMDNGITNITFINCSDGNNTFNGFDAYLIEGKNSVTVWGNDTVGLYSIPHQHNFTIDTINPTVDYNYPTPNDSTYLSINSFIANVSADDLNFANLTLILANLSDTLYIVSSTDKNIVFNFSGLENNPYTLTAIAYDLAGHSYSPVPLIIFINSSTIPPVIEETPIQPIKFSDTMNEIGVGMGSFLSNLTHGGLLSFIILIAIVGGIVMIFYSVTNLIKNKIHGVSR